MTTSLVEQLQADALDRNVPTVDLLRKAMVVARKLQVDDISEWISLELDGYPSADSLPEYREVYGEIYALNPVRGQVPVNFPNKEQAAIAHRVTFTNSVSELEHLLTQVQSDNGALRIRRGDLDARGPYAGTKFPVYQSVSPAALRGVLDRVRNLVLKWALDLEQKGIVGSGLSFSDREKQAAQGVHYNITNNFGDNAVAQFSHGNDNVLNVHTTTAVPLDQVRDLITALTEASKAQGSAPLEQRLGELQAIVKEAKPEKSKLRNALVMLKDAATFASVAPDAIEKISDLITVLS